ncbi:hypothetical protein GCM10011297_14900 [Bacterioplanes sanyensis]|uniref:hypothetical protein n=1 Tax=Bacterioplanes sanyensis TaxID=1249553 RepID=UPI00167A36D7|nr:hypothetical protein [Bacterioplanes sanyensis]GGY43164.1 hypothetical protein GCM10011297_14900 [Bacterioplanes sanyensis]
MSFLKLRAAFIIARARLVSFLKGTELDRHIYSSLKKNQVECFSRSVYLQWLYVSAISDRDQARLVGLFEEFGLLNIVGGGRIYIATIESLIWLGKLDLASGALQTFKSVSNSEADIEYLGHL